MRGCDAAAATSCVLGVPSGCVVVARPTGGRAARALNVHSVHDGSGARSYCRALSVVSSKPVPTTVACRPSTQQTSGTPRSRPRCSSSTRRAPLSSATPVVSVNTWLGSWLTRRDAATSASSPRSDGAPWKSSVDWCAAWCAWK
eukprot:2172839-Prymnesium_polylepis.1